MWLRRNIWFNQQASNGVGVMFTGLENMVEPYVSSQPHLSHILFALIDGSVVVLAAVRSRGTFSTRLGSTDVNRGGYRSFRHQMSHLLPRILAPECSFHILGCVSVIVS